MNDQHWNYMIELLSGTLDNISNQDDRMLTDMSCAYVEAFLIEKDAVITYYNYKIEK
jgi:hypothetical protein